MLHSTKTKVFIIDFFKATHIRKSNLSQAKGSIKVSWIQAKLNIQSYDT